MQYFSKNRTFLKSKTQIARFYWGEPHSLVAHRAQAQCIMVRSLRSFVRSFVRTLYVRTRNFSYSDLPGFLFRLSPADNFSWDMR